MAAREYYPAYIPRRAEQQHSEVETHNRKQEIYNKNGIFIL